MKLHTVKFAGVVSVIDSYLFWNMFNLTCFRYHKFENPKEHENRYTMDRVRELESKGEFSFSDITFKITE